MDTSYLPLIVAAALITYATRVSGLAFGDRQLPPAAHRFLHYVPIAAFSALAVPGIAINDRDLLPRLLAAAVAGIAVLRFGQLWICLAVGMGCFWLTRWIV